MQYIGVLPHRFGIGMHGEVAVSNIINFLSPVLDSRVQYTGPVHSYWAADGSLKQSGVNEFPLEYRGGVAVGRHPPEKASTNYATDYTFSTLDAGTYQVKAPGTTPTVQTDSLGVPSVLAHGSCTLAGIYSESQAAWLATAVDKGTPTDWTDVVVSNLSSQASIQRWYYARASASLYMYAKTLSVPSGYVTASCLRKYDSNGVYTAVPQVEPGITRTSPILAAAGVAGVRAAASAVITAPGYTSCLLTYSDSSTRTVSESSTGSGSFSIPTAGAWGSKYLVTATLS